MANIIAVILGAIAGIVGTSLLRHKGVRRRQASTAVIVLEGHADHNRRATVFPQVICVEKGGQIEWEVRDLNNPENDANVTFEWIRHPDNHSKEKDPLVGPPTNVGNKKRKGRVKPHPRTRHYRYRVLENGRCVTDPDVEIMM